jgi:hypothetical protein
VLQKVLDKWTEILDKGVDIIYCDFMKAFEFAHFQSSGNSPVLIEVSKILAKGVHSDMLTSVSTRGCIPSGPGDFKIFKLSSFFLTFKQFGFISGRSTVLQLLQVLEKWTEILDKGGCVDTIYCDFMKAFDKVPHLRLIHKLEKYQI